MKKLLRIGFRGTIVGAVLIAVLLLAALDGVDHRPYFREPYYVESSARLRAELATNRVVQGELQAGFGEARLTPTLNAPEDDPAHGRFKALPLAGYGNRKGRPATGVHDDVFVKAVALRVADRTVVMLGVDALIVPPEVAELASSRLAKESGLPRASLYLSATHTHSSLGGWGEGWVGEAFAGGFQPGARIWFADCIVEATRSALADLKPAALGQGRFEAAEFVRNRLVGELGRVDPEFSFSIVKQAGGRVAVLGSFAAHATVLGGDSMVFSADYPGFWRRAVEESTGGMAVFLAGGVGSHSPNSGGKGFEGAERMGRALAERLGREMAQVALTDRVTLGLVALNFAMPPFNVRVSDGLRLRPWLARRLLHAPDHNWIQAVRLNDAIWVSTPCDFSGELALGIKDSLRARGKHAVITSFNGGYIGYVIDSRYYHMEGYEPRTMSFFGPNVPDYLEEMIRTMAFALAAR